MKNKIISIFICMLLITTIIPIMNAIGENIVNNKSYTNGEKDGFILDQMQTIGGFYDIITSGNSLAQTFKPSITPLAKIRLLLSAEGQISEPLDISIRDDLYGEDLTFISVSSNEIPLTPEWINFDFPDITVNVNETYYIIAKTNSNKEYHWIIAYNQDIDYYDRGSGWFRNLTISGNWLNWDEFHRPYNDFCFKTYSYTGKESDLKCNGIFGWTDQKPGSLINDSFTIQNIGDQDSLLNWKIEEIPTWGNWTFTQMEGYDLTPEENSITINVSVKIPNEKNEAYSGEVKIVNKDNESDYSIISVTLSTTKYKSKTPYELISPILQRILKRFSFFRYFLTKI